MTSPAQKAVSAKPLSELEGSVLAIIWRDGPITPYSVRKLARESRSPQLSSSAGSVYPLIERLADRGLIEGEPFSQGEREGVAYRVTKVGLDEVRAWIERPASEVASGALVDPIRTRLLMLGALPPSRRQRVVRELREALEDDLAQLEAHARELVDGNADESFRTACRGDLLVQRARLKWLREVGAQLG